MPRCLRLGLLGWLSFALGLQAASTISDVNRFAYGANIGWMDWRADGGGAGVGEFVCFGRGYAANTGWIDLGNGAPANGIRYRNDSAVDFGVNHDGIGGLTGLAWGANIGWLVFTNRDAAGSAFEGPRVDLRTGKFSGWVWSANCGWISLSNALAFVQTDSIAAGADTDGDGIPDGWELSFTGNLTTMNGSTDLDADGSADLQEYLADTNPLLATDSLRITGFSFAPNGTNALVTWTSRPTRDYFIQKRAGLETSNVWNDAGPARVVPDPGATTSRPVSDSPSPQRFLRIEAVRPLNR
jgi:hypothetical protein